MRLDVEEAVLLDVGADMVAAASIVIPILVTTLMGFQEGTDPLKRERVESKLKGVAMVGLEVLSVGVAVVVLMMENLEKRNALAGSMIAVVGLDVG